MPETKETTQAGGGLGGDKPMTAAEEAKWLEERAKRREVEDKSVHGPKEQAKP